MKSTGRIARIGIVVLYCVIGYGVFAWLDKAQSDKSAIIKRETVTTKGPNSHKGVSGTNNSAPRLRIGSREDTDQNATSATEKQSSTLSSVLGGSLNSEPLDVGSRVRAMQELRGRNFSEDDREIALLFLAGKNLPGGMGRASTQWLADEMLTALRLQEPPWPGMANALSEVAFQADTDPVVRDYIIQHLGLYWETAGLKPEIEVALWKAVISSDETTPGTALIALSRGYARDQQPKSLEEVQSKALVLALNPHTTLAVRVTALSIAGEGGGVEVKKLATALIQDPETPIVLRKVAEQVVR